MHHWEKKCHEHEETMKHHDITIHKLTEECKTWKDKCSFFEHEIKEWHEKYEHCSKRLHELEEKWHHGVKVIVHLRKECHRIREMAHYLSLIHISEPTRPY